VFGRTLSNSDIAALFAAALGITPPAIVLEPTSTARYSGLPITFNCVVTGSSPSYQWFKGSQALADGGNVSGAETTTLTVNNVGSTDVGSYTLVATNSSGSVTSSIVTLAVQGHSSAAYERAVLAANPISYWRLNETNDPSSATLLAYDYVGGFNGTYGLASRDSFNNVAGPRPTDGFAIFETNNTAMRSRSATDQSWVTAPQPTLNTNAATFTMWVYPDGDQAAWSGLLMNRSGDGEGVGLTGGSDDMLVYTWNSNSTWSFVSGLTVPSNQWSFLTVAVEPTRAILYVANTNGIRTATNPIVHVAEPWGGSADIGNDPGFNNGRVFNGIVDEVAIFNYTLSPQQVQNLFQVTSTASRPTLTITAAPADKLTINWAGTGTLQSTPSLQGASTVWSDLGTTSPLTVTPTGTAQFYRVRTP
jgi:hypothetical protein